MTGFVHHYGLEHAIKANGLRKAKAKRLITLSKFTQRLCTRYEFEIPPAFS